MQRSSLTRCLIVSCTYAVQRAVARAASENCILATAIAVFVLTAARSCANSTHRASAARSRFSLMLARLSRTDSR